MSALVDIARGEPEEPAQLTAAFTQAGVVFGVDAEACRSLAEALQDPEASVEGARVATGVAAVLGSDGYFAPAFEPGIQPGHVSEDGKMDFRDRELLKPVKARAPLGWLHAALPGSPGKRVDGEVIAVPTVREASLTLGPGVCRAPDGHLSAAVDGVILYVAPNRLDVVRHHDHRGDVDLRSGHLAMEGSLRVRGDVQRLFRVRATGDVEIVGSVNGGSVHAGGSLSVRGVVQGGSEGELSARGDVRARGAEGAKIRGRGLLKLETAVHCLLEACVIDVGVLRGGHAHAERTVLVKEAGLAAGGETLLVVGEPLELATDEVRSALSEARSERWHQRARGAGERGRNGKGGRARPALQRDTLERMLVLRQRRDELQQAAHVVVNVIAHPGVTIQIGEARLTLAKPVTSTRFSYHAPTRSIRSERFVP